MLIEETIENIFKIVKMMVKGNQFIISEQCTMNDDVVLAVSDEGKKVARKVIMRKF